jgi:hypothetical protein
MTIPPQIASEFELTPQQTMQRILEDFGDASMLLGTALKNIANNPRVPADVRAYAKRTINGSNSIIGYG